MSENDRMVSEVDDGMLCILSVLTLTSSTHSPLNFHLIEYLCWCFSLGDIMIKYLRDKIIGHPAVFSRAGELPIEDMPPMKRTNSQNSLNDLMSASTISNDTTSQVEKLLAAAAAGRRPTSSSSPIIIPKKPSRSNESSMPSDDVSMPTLPSACQQLEHSAARDRISVKNKRRQPLKQKLSTLRETDDNDVDLFASKIDDNNDNDDLIVPAVPSKQSYIFNHLFSSPSTTAMTISSTPDDEQSRIMMTSHVEPKILQPLFDSSDLDSARARLRMSVRPRDRSADNILLATNTNMTSETSSTRPTLAPVNSSPIQRSVSFKRPQEINDIKLKPRPILKSRKEESRKNDLPSTKAMENESTSVDPPNHDEETQSLSRSRSSSQEHIYDNLDVFKRPKPTNIMPSHEDEPSPATYVKTREHPVSTPRLRPTTMLVPTNNDKPSTNEFENVFNQFKKRGSIRRAPANEETAIAPVPVEEARAPTPPPSAVPVQPINEPTAKPADTTPVLQASNRRKTVGGVCLPAGNKVATNDNKPAASWIDIAKQKQNKFQSISNDKKHENESEQAVLHEPVVITRKTTPSTDVRLNRKSMFEQPTNQSNSHVLERIMDLSSSAGQGIGDPQLASFIEQENQKQRFQSVVHSLTEQCWEICSPSISSRLDGKSETCLANCVERFIDSSNYIINKLGQEGAAAVASMKSNEFSTSTDFSLGAPDMGLQSPEFSSGFSSSTSQEEKKSSWRFW
ncbi:unnamed protein product [Adineta ricciae]|uniref:Tim10-like domain-containing protein n=2 Tax=Adineta ricciae TaxID=249248 RepID=A0A814AHB2_ADIRI|nr:unnamed protein product [Adineta ricciae]